MAAVLGLSMNELEDLIRNEMASDIIDIANDNCPGQIVVSGTTDSIDKIIALLSNIGKRAVKLQVSAPFHSRLMEPVKEIMAESLAQTKINQAIIPVIANVTARDEIDPRKIAQNLALQVSARVRWTETVEYLISQNITKFVEIGPGQVLSGLMKRINRDVQIVSINSIADMDLI
jgi:[acyl-carrier-protein] S-malonyltransferase